MESLDHHHDEMPEGRGFDRRSFLKLAGFAFAGTVMAGCERPVLEKAIPYLIKPEEITPGGAYWYASTCHGCAAGCGVLVKNRDGRPIKVEGNPVHPLSGGGLCVVGQATVLGVYDSQRLAGPVLKDSPASWGEVDRYISEQIIELRARKQGIRVLTGTITSPTLKRQIERFVGSFADGKHVMYDPLSCASILDAHGLTHGVRVLPRYLFEKASVIVSFGADFLGTWISPVEFTRGYVSGRRLDGASSRVSYHAQIESRFSLTGSKADKRYPVSPGVSRKLIQALAAIIERMAGGRSYLAQGSLDSGEEKIVQDIARRLEDAPGKGLVIAGSNDVESQILVNYINHLLGNYDSTLDINRPSFQRMGDDIGLSGLREEINSGTIGMLVVHGANPVYDLPDGEGFAEDLKNIPLIISTAERVDETAQHAHVLCPDHHFLESWSDGEPVAGLRTITQPAIAPLGKTRSFMESLSTWSGQQDVALDLIQREWKASVFPRQSAERDFQAFWDKSVHDGFASINADKSHPAPFRVSAVNDVGPHAPLPESLALVLYPKVSMSDGRHAHNPWLQEVPDPMTKVVWDNYASLSPGTAASLGIEEGDVVRVSVDTGGRKREVELPALIQVGQDERVVAIALGYGRKGTERFTDIGPQWWEAKPSVGPHGLVGVNAAPLLDFKQGVIRYDGSPVTVEKTGKRQRLAMTQTYHSVDMPRNLSSEGAERRPLIQETTLAAYTQDSSSGSFPKPKSSSMWSEQHKFEGHHWGMVIDLNACTGCSACIVSCQAENNLPVVGKDEVARNREMHWLRIDRYYMENGDNVDVAHQPMLCHHCDNAPCETVCPVLATVHSDEGLNQQVYNRCVGTRYCANNCPYKIRRFNWFDYAREERMENMVLNPDVTVRSRGVMEKCSFCVQRITEQKIAAKAAGLPVADGSIKTACQQSCPAQAISFGDMNDKESIVSRDILDDRHYRLLTELEIRPSVGYKTIVRNRPEVSGDQTHG